MLIWFYNLIYPITLLKKIIYIILIILIKYI